jgi:hypothetical protein
MLKRGAWSIDEDNALRNAVHRHHGKNWKLVAEEVGTRSNSQCLQRWCKTLNPEVEKGECILAMLKVRSNWMFFPKGDGQRPRISI